MDIHTVLEWIPIIWLAINALYSYLRGFPKETAIYTVVLFGAMLVMLNLGGFLNDFTWRIATVLVFGLEVIWRGWKGPRWKIPIAVILLIAALI